MKTGRREISEANVKVHDLKKVKGRKEQTFLFALAPKMRQIVNDAAGGAQVMSFSKIIAVRVSRFAPRKKKLQREKMTTGLVTK